MIVGGDFNDHVGRLSQTEMNFGLVAQRTNDGELPMKLPRTTLYS